MNNPTTGYICQNASGIYQDLSGIFQGGNSGVVTGFKMATGVDLGSIFSANTGSSITFSTNFIARNGQDLKLVFAPYNNTPFVISGFTQTTTNPFYRDVSGNYAGVSGNNYYAGLRGNSGVEGSYYYNTGYLFIFQKVGLLTSTASVTGSIKIPYNATIKYHLIGGGGAGGISGGGAGGDYQTSNINVNSGTTMSLTIGSGGPPSGGGGAGGNTSFNSTIALGGSFENGGVNGVRKEKKGNRFIDNLGNTYYYGAGGGDGGGVSGGGYGYNSMGGPTSVGGGGGGGINNNGEAGETYSQNGNGGKGGTGGTGGTSGGNANNNPIGYFYSGGIASGAGGGGGAGVRYSNLDYSSLNGTSGGNGGNGGIGGGGGSGGIYYGIGTGHGTGGNGGVGGGGGYGSVGGYGGINGGGGGGSTDQVKGGFGGAGLIVLEIIPR